MQLVDVVGVRSAMERRCSSPLPPSFTSSPRSTPDGLTFTISSRRVGRFLPDEVRADRQLPVAAVDHDGELHRSHPPEGVEGVQGGADRAAGEEHVVDQHDDGAVEVDGDLGDRLGQHRADADVVAVQGDVEGADRRAGAVDLSEGFGEGLGQRTPPVCSPTSTTPSRPWLRSTISWAIRQMARRTSSASITWDRATKTPPYGGVERRSRSAKPDPSCPCEPHGTRFTVRRRGPYARQWRGEDSTARRCRFAHGSKPAARATPPEPGLAGSHRATDGGDAQLLDRPRRHQRGGPGRQPRPRWEASHPPPDLGRADVAPKPDQPTSPATRPRGRSPGRATGLGPVDRRRPRSSAGRQRGPVPGARRSTRATSGSDHAATSAAASSGRHGRSVSSPSDRGGSGNGTRAAAVVGSPDELPARRAGTQRLVDVGEHAPPASRGHAPPRRARGCRPRTAQRSSGTPIRSAAAWNASRGGLAAPMSAELDDASNAAAIPTTRGRRSAASWRWTAAPPATDRRTSDTRSSTPSSIVQPGRPRLGHRRAVDAVAQRRPPRRSPRTTPRTGGARP